MLKYIIMFVLVITMVKTNAQSITPVIYNYNGNSTTLNETDNRLLIRLADETNAGDHADLRAKIAADPNFTTLLEGGRYYVLQRNTGSTITKANAINYYITEPYIGYVSFLFDVGGGDYCGVTQELLAKPADGVTVDDIEDVVASMGLTSIRQFDESADIYNLYFDKSVDILATVNQVFQTGLFEYVEPNLFISIANLNGTNSTSCGSAPSINDPDMPDQWGLHNTGTSTYGGNAGADINICHAWNVIDAEGNNVDVDGDGVIVAVVDDGVYTPHPDLANNIYKIGGVVQGFDAIPPGTTPPMYYACTDPGCSDIWSSHGTQCAGIIGAEQNDAYGISGIAYKAKIMPIRMFYNNGTGNYTDVSFMSSGINYATTHGADIISCSWGFQPGVDVMYSATLQARIVTAATSGRGGKGCIVIFSSGNFYSTTTTYNESDIWWPASNPNVIPIGAMSMCDERKSFLSCDGQITWASNYGFGKPMPFYTSINTTGYVSMVAPGVDILTTRQSVATLPVSYGHGTFAGTSAACPHASGVAALMLSVDPCLTLAELRRVLETTAEQISGYTYAPTTGVINGDWNNEVGHGRLNAGDAVMMVHDMYKQNELEGGTRNFQTGINLFAGFNVTSSKSPGYYTVLPGGRVEFLSAGKIELREGFEAESNSVFNAQITSTCNNSHEHYKQRNSKNLTQILWSRDSKNEAVAGMKLHPNPVRDLLNLSFSVMKDEKVSFSVSNIMGQKVSEVNTKDMVKGTHTETINIRHLSPGVYLLTVQTGTAYSQFKFVKE